MTIGAIFLLVLLVAALTSKPEPKSWLDDIKPEPRTNRTPEEIVRNYKGNTP